VTLDHIDPMCSLSFSSIHIGLYALILYLSLIFRIWVYTWLVMHSHAVMSVVQVFSSFVMLSLACVSVSDGVPLSNPIPRKRERSLHTCAQDVQITHMATI
jgi:uncharacterized membrane protein